MTIAPGAPAAMAVRAASELRPAFVSPRAAAKVETRLGCFGFRHVVGPQMDRTPTYAVLA